MEMRRSLPVVALLLIAAGVAVTELPWQQIVGDGFGDPAVQAVFSLAVFQGQLYAGTYKYNILTAREAGLSSDSEDPRSESRGPQSDARSLRVRPPTSTMVAAISDPASLRSRLYGARGGSRGAAPRGSRVGLGNGPASRAWKGEPRCSTSPPREGAAGFASGPVRHPASGRDGSL
jgi:hypothetical protein